MAPHPSPDDLLACAVDAARAAGEHALANLHRRRETIQSSRYDLKLRLDVECQARAEAVIRGAFPDHAFLGEESGAADHAAADPGRCQWIVDPIDGTVNFSHGLPFWCCSVAVRQGAQTLAGAVYAPAVRDLFTAAADGPARLNGEAIRVSDVADLAGAIVMTGMDRGVAPDVPPYTFFTRIASAAQKARIIGSAALDMCAVACGRADGYFEAGVFIWDVAAAALITERAGGRAELLRRQPANRISFAASNGLIHDGLVSALGLP